MTEIQEKEVNLCYMTFDKEKDVENNRIYKLSGVIEGKNFYIFEELTFDKDYIEKVKEKKITEVPLFEREGIDSKEMIPTNYFKKQGITFKENIYKYIEADSEGELIMYNALADITIMPTSI